MDFFFYLLSLIVLQRIPRVIEFLNIKNIEKQHNISFPLMNPREMEPWEFTLQFE
jgi:hypothetical protein